MYQNKFNKVAPGFGVGEWAGYSYNVGIGCSHDCKYCYSRSFFVSEGIVRNNEAWPTERPNPRKAIIEQKADKRVMFPSTHDISPNYLEVYCRALYNILNAGNTVLLVSKPHFACIEHICNEFAGFKAQMEFRFTIGSLDPVVTTFWEPGAPLPEERIRCLVHATEQGFQTSVSMEPMLEGKEAAITTFQTLAPLTNGTIWIGLMNDIEKRADMTAPLMKDAVDKIKQLQTPEEALQLYRILQLEEKVRWKESISNIVKRA